MASNPSSPFPSKIHLLPEDLIRRIAAGEVVERPASVLKELLENSLDAGAHHIVVEWQEAGQKLLRVTDDGQGMAPEDAKLALKRHATSKISSLDDLERIFTFGFRGEALPSIAAVSRFTLTTKTLDATEAWKIECEGGDVRREGPAGAPKGTTIIVEDLFFNTPARKKFLKAESTEKGQLLRTVEDVALAALSVDFQVIADGKEISSMRTAYDGESLEDSLLTRIEEAWGSDAVQSLKLVRQSGRFLTVWGWISDIHASQSTGRQQRLYVNRRPIMNKRLSHAIYEAYKGSLPAGRHPAAVLFFDIDPAFVDVNVHPSKREVRFSHESEIYGFLLNALQTTLSSSAAMPQTFKTDPAPSSRPISQVPPLPSSAEARESLYFQAKRSSFLQAHDAPVAVPEQDDIPLFVDQDVFRKAAPQPLLQMDMTYILARLDDKLFIFDQHAAAERVLYEKLSNASKNSAPERQALLLPWVWELSAQAAAIVKDHLADFTRLGFTLEPFGGIAFRVVAVPGILGDSPKIRAMLEGLAEDLIGENNVRGWESFVVRAACRGSVKANDPLKIPEMEKIIRDLQKCERPWSCPHGRPTFLRLSAEELAKRFKRT